MCLFWLIKNIIVSPEEAKGSAGERKIKRQLELIDFLGYSGLCLKNVYVPKSDGTTSEIDVLYITPKAIFVIESKNFSGYIFGNEKNKNWTATYYAGKNFFGKSQVEKIHFYNPIRQNRSHLNHLRAYLKCNIPMYSIIVFSDECEIKDLRTQSNDFIICHQQQFKSIIKMILDESFDVLSDNDFQKICRKLTPLTNQDKEIKQMHIAEIKCKNGMRCPRCNGTLVLRVARNGMYDGNKFYGCSNYPKCKYIKNC